MSNDQTGRHLQLDKINALSAPTDRKLVDDLLWGVEKLRKRDNEDAEENE